MAPSTARYLHLLFSCIFRPSRSLFSPQQIVFTMEFRSELPEPAWLVLVVIVVAVTRVCLDRVNPGHEQPAPITRTWDGHHPLQCTNGLCASLKSSVDPLMSAMAHNSTCSPLTRLPEELLLELMKYLVLSPADLQCLRHTSRVFMRLYAFPEFARTNDIELKPFTRQTFWVQPGRPYLQRSHEKEAAARVPRDDGDYCSDCRAGLFTSDWYGERWKLMVDQQHCFKCWRTHPRALFSAAQRSVLACVSHWYNCIGRSGHIRLCTHKVISWDGLETLASRLARTHPVPAVEWPVLHCTHSSHRPKHHDPAGGGSDKGSPCGKLTLPSASLKLDHKHRITLLLRYQGHLLVETPGPDGTSPAQLRKQLEVLRQGCAEFIEAVMAPGRIPEMNCFDPNRCSCLVLQGRENLKPWAMPHPSHLTQPSCRLAGQCRLSALQPRSELFPATDDKTDAPFNEDYGARKHCSSIKTTGAGNHGASRLEIEVERCETGDHRCITIAWRREIDMCRSKMGCYLWDDNKITPGWYPALDPESYGLTQDSRAYGVTWCHTPGCLNYYKYLRKAVVRSKGSR